MAPVCMLNALWFRPDGGAQRYAEYGRAVQPLLAGAGADIVAPFLPVERALEGGFDPDLVGFVRYPSWEAFLGMVQSDDYGRIAHLRTEAITKAVLTRCRIEPEDAQALTDLPAGVVVFNGLWFNEGGSARYDDYLATARPLVEQRGGRFLSPRFRPDRAIEGDLEPDLVFLGLYPSEQSVLDLVGDPAYRPAAAIRSEAVDRSVTTLLRTG